MWSLHKPWAMVTSFFSSPFPSWTWASPVKHENATCYFLLLCVCFVACKDREPPIDPDVKADWHVSLFLIFGDNFLLYAAGSDLTPE